MAESITVMSKKAEPVQMTCREVIAEFDKLTWGEDLTFYKDATCDSFVADEKSSTTLKFLRRIIDLRDLGKLFRVAVQQNHDVLRRAVLLYLCAIVKGGSTGSLKNQLSEKLGNDQNVVEALVMKCGVEMKEANDFTVV